MTGINRSKGSKTELPLAVAGQVTTPIWPLRYKLLTSTIIIISLPGSHLNSSSKESKREYLFLKAEVIAIPSASVLDSFSWLHSKQICSCSLYCYCTWTITPPCTLPLLYQICSTRSLIMTHDCSKQNCSCRWIFTALSSLMTESKISRDSQCNCIQKLFSGLGGGEHPEHPKVFSPEGGWVPEQLPMAVVTVSA